MKKYLLLAATAMLFSTNAMADPLPSLPNQTANVNVSAAIVPVCTFLTDSSTIDFGTLYVADLDESGTFDAVMYYDEGGTPSGNNVIGTAGTSSLAYLETTCTFQGVSHPDFTVSCVNSGTTSEGCQIGSTQYKIIPNYPDIYSSFYVGGQIFGPIPAEPVNLIMNKSFNPTFL